MLYFLLILISSFITWIAIESKHRIIKIPLSILAVLIPSFFFGFRDQIGSDFQNYVNHFYDIQLGYETRLEWGYEAINRLVAELGFTEHALFFVVGIIMFIFLHLTFERYKHLLNPGLAMFTFMSFFYQMSFNIVRQVMTITVILYSIKFIEERKLIKFIFIILLASSFHTSALLFLPVYFVNDLLEKTNKKISQILIYIVVILGVILLDYIAAPLFSNLESFEQYSRYLNDVDSTNEGLGFVLRTIPFLILGIYLYKDGNKYYRNYSLYFSIFVMGFLLGFSRFVGAPFLSRITLNYDVIIVLLLPIFIKILNKRGEYWLSWLTISYVFIHWWYIYIYIGSHGTFPYQWIF